MWSKPREGTEAHRVEQEVEKRKKQALEKGLPRLVSDLWFDTGLENYYSWQKNSKEYIHPDIKNLKEVKDKEYEKILEFDMRGRHYKILSKKENYSSFLPSDNITHTFEISIYIDEERAFGCDVHEEYHDSDIGWGYSDYIPGTINYYINEDWVNDWKDIKDYHEKISRQKQIDSAEDPEKVKKMREDFGIKENSLPSLETNETNLSETKDGDKKPFWKKAWFWIVVLILLIIFSS